MDPDENDPQMDPKLDPEPTTDGPPLPLMTPVKKLSYITIVQDLFKFIYNKEPRSSNNSTKKSDDLLCLSCYEKNLLIGVTLECCRGSKKIRE